MSWMIFLVLLASCFAAGSAGALFPPGEWYRSLKKPGFTPPDWVFPVVWTTLYVLIALAGARVANLPDAGLALALWALQVALNSIWTPIFFGLKKVRMALVVVSLLWLSVAFGMLALFQLDTLAGLMFVPYLIWVSIATALNLRVMQLNPELR
jgi:tryptophan-rich sensory protein